jgi:hypothetical protein
MFPALSVHDAIPVAEPAGGLAVLDSPPQPAVSLRGQVFQEQGVHRALESDVQVRDVAFGDRDDVDAGECQSFEQAGGVFLVAAESVQGLGETSNRRLRASRISDWKPGRRSVAPETA